MELINFTNVVKLVVKLGGAARRGGVRLYVTPWVGRLSELPNTHIHDKPHFKEVVKI